jgi:ADP-ribosylglycohydrolase
MIGSVIGDVIGSKYEFEFNKPNYDFELFTSESAFTDDTVCSVAVANSILSDDSFKNSLLKYCKLYPNAGYGSRFSNWVMATNPMPYDSYGNGSAMRVGPVGWGYNTLEEVLEKAKESAECSHNHLEGIRGAQAVAACVFLARTGSTKNQIKFYIESNFGYNLNLNMDELRKYYEFNELCQDTVPQAIYTFLESTSFEDSIRKAIYIGGDSDTLACINGSIAEAYYKEIPKYIIVETIKRLDDTLRKILIPFLETFGDSSIFKSVMHESAKFKFDSTFKRSKKI